jgi:hypothetical protein
MHPASVCGSYCQNRADMTSVTQDQGCGHHAEMQHAKGMRSSSKCSREGQEMMEPWHIQPRAHAMVQSVILTVPCAERYEAEWLLRQPARPKTA